MARNPYLKALTALLFVGGLFIIFKVLLSLGETLSSLTYDFSFYYNVGKEMSLSVSKSEHLLPHASRFIYWPLAVFPRQVSQNIWIIGSLILYMLTIRKLIFGYLKPTLTILVIAVGTALFPFPARFSLHIGQVNMIVLFVIVVSVLMEQRKKSIIAGILFTVAVLMKPEIILLTPAIILGRRFHMLTSFICTGIVAVTCSIMLWGIDAHSMYFARMSNVYGIDGMGIYFNQSLMGTLVRAGVTHELALYAIIISVWVVTCIMFFRSRIRFPDIVWAFLPVFILTEPIAWQHHLVFLVPAYILFANHSKSWLTRFALLTSYILVSGHLGSTGYLSGVPFSWVLVSHGTLGVILLWGLSLRYAYNQK